MSAQDEGPFEAGGMEIDDEDDVDEEDDDAPELVPAEESRPSKRQRTD